MKKIKYFMCIAAAALLLGGCGGKENQDVSRESAGMQESSPEESQGTEGNRLQPRVGSKVPDAFLEIGRASCRERVFRAV